MDRSFVGVKTKISLVRLVAYFTHPRLGTSSLRHVNQLHMPLRIVLPWYLLFTEQTHINIRPDSLQVIFLMARVTLKGAFTDSLLVFPVVSSHMVILSSFCAESCFTIGALVSKKVLEMFCLHMVSDASDCFIGEGLANCADVTPRNAIFLHINV